MSRAKNDAMMNHMHCQQIVRKTQIWLKYGYKYLSIVYYNNKNSTKQTCKNICWKLFDNCKVYSLLSLLFFQNVCTLSMSMTCPAYINLWGRPNMFCAAVERFWKFFAQFCMPMGTLVRMLLLD